MTPQDTWTILRAKLQSGQWATLAEQAEVVTWGDEVLRRMLVAEEIASKKRKVKT